jgi:hypothetical protein
VAKIVWDRYKIPVFMYFTHASYIQNPPGYNLDNTAQGLPAYFGSLPQDNALSMPVFVAKGADGRPIDAASPVKDANNVLTMGTGYWWFWLFNASPLEWLFYGNRDAMYKMLNFTVTPTVHACPAGQHWDATANACVADQPIPDDDDWAAKIAALDVRITALENWRHS